MKTLLFLCGPNGIGKTSISKSILSQLKDSAYVDTDPLRYMNPFVLDDTTIPLITQNISGLLLNYLRSPNVKYLIFSYGFHGRRKEIFDAVMKAIEGEDFSFKPFLLTCDLDENIRRMKSDNRDSDRIKRGVERSRLAYENVTYPNIDITHFTIEESVKEIMKQAQIDTK